MSSGKRITILSQDENDYLYGIPKLTNKDRVVIFEDAVKTDADWKISIMLLNKAGNQGLIRPPFTAIRMV